MLSIISPAALQLVALSVIKFIFHFTEAIHSFKKHRPICRSSHKIEHFEKTLLRTTKPWHLTTMLVLLELETKRRFCCFFNFKVLIIEIEEGELVSFVGEGKRF